MSLRAREMLGSPIHAGRVPRGFRASTERWHRRLSSSRRPDVSLIVLEEARTSKLVSPIATGGAPAFLGRDTTYNCPRLFVAGIPGGTVLGDTGEVVDPKGVILADLSLMHPESVQPWVYKLHKPFRLCQPPPEAEPLGRACTVVSQYASNNYFHWMLNLLPRFELLRRAGVRWNGLDAIVINQIRHPFQSHTLDRIGIPVDKLVEAEEDYCGRAETLFATRSLRAAGHRCQFALNFLRDLFQDCLSDSGGRKIYVSRSDASKRRVVNEKALAPLLEARGIEVVSLSGMSVCDQVRLFSAADVIVAPHGAGLTNLTFCREGTKVIEIHSARFLKKYYWELASARRLRYYSMVVADEFSTASVPGDFEIVPDELGDVLDLARM